MAFTAKDYEAKKRLRAERRAQGLCVHCGKPNDHKHRWGRRKAMYRGGVLVPTRRDRAKENGQWLSDIRVASGCKVCGERHPACLEFHHRDQSTKELNFSSSKAMSRSRLAAEVAKCDVLCANCHKKHHYETKTGPWRIRAVA